MSQFRQASLLTALGLLTFAAVACTLNPQPLPPMEATPGDAGAFGVADAASKSAAPEVQTGDGADAATSSDSGVPPENDAGGDASSDASADADSSI